VVRLHRRQASTSHVHLIVLLLEQVFEVLDLALQHVNFAVLDVHVLLELGEIVCRAVSVLLRLQNALRLLLD
jgi:hypothetical protein